MKREIFLIFLLKLKSKKLLWKSPSNTDYELNITGSVVQIVQAITKGNVSKCEKSVKLLTY